MTRRYPGTGSVDQLPSGRWRVRMRGPDGKQTTVGTYATEAEARAVCDGGAHVLAAKSQTGPMTLRAWGVEWFKAREAAGLRGVAQEKSVWNRHVETSTLAPLPLREIGRPAVVTWLAGVVATKVTRSARGGAKGAREATDRTISRGTAAHALHVLRGAITAARDAGHCPLDPTDGVKVPRRGKGEDPWTYLTAAEVARVGACAEIPERERLLYVVAIYTGLRRGELWALTRADVVLDGPAPEVTVSKSHGGTTKTGKTRRVPLLPPAREALRAVLASHARELVFPSDDGDMRSEDDDARWAPQTRRYTLKDGTHKHYRVAGYRERAGITRRVRFHDLRHTCASHLLMGTWGIALQLHEVAAWLGHGSITMTERYAHLCPDRLAAKVAAKVGEGAGEGSARDSRRDSPESRNLSKRRARRESNPQPSDPKSDATSLENQHVTSSRDSRVTPAGATDEVVALAVTVLTAVAMGEGAPAGPARALARAAILGGWGLDAALAVLEGEPAAQRRVVELAREVLARAGIGTTAATPRAGEGSR